MDWRLREKEQEVKSLKDEIEWIQEEKSMRREEEKRNLQSEEELEWQKSEIKQHYNNQVEELSAFYGQKLKHLNAQTQELTQKLQLQQKNSVSKDLFIKMEMSKNQQIHLLREKLEEFEAKLLIWF